MRNYNRVTQLALAAMAVAALVVATIWLLNPAEVEPDGTDVAKQAWSLIESGALVLDVRTREEFDEGHLQAAVNIPFEDTDAIIKAIGSDQQRQVVVYCGSGKRAGKALDALAEAGYNNVFNANGYQALQSTHP